MACNPNQKRITIDINGDWRKFQKEELPSYEMIGIVSRGSEDPGALAKNKHTGEYVQINNGVETFLLQRKVIAAISFLEKD